AASSSAASAIRRCSIAGTRRKRASRCRDGPASRRRDVPASRFRDGLAPRTKTFVQLDGRRRNAVEPDSAKREVRMTLKFPARWAAALWLAASIGFAFAQPIGVPVPPLGDGPWVFDTAEQHKIRVSVVIEGMAHPWAIAFLPNGDMLITERAGRLRIVRDGVLDPEPIAGLPDVRTDGNGGLMDVALHPEFDTNRLVYFTYTKPVDDGMGTPALARGRLEGHALVDVEDLVVPDYYEGNSGLNGRVVFGRDGKVYMSRSEEHTSE